MSQDVSSSVYLWASQPPTVTGGGGPPSAALVEWTPDGQVNAPRCGVMASMTQLALNRNQNVGVQVTMGGLLQEFDTKQVGVQATMSQLALSNDKSVGAQVTMSQLALSNNKNVGAQITMSNLALSRDQNVGVQLTGSVLGAPFWQTEAHIANTDGNNTSGLTVSKPAGTLDGDLLLMLVGQATLGGVPAAATLPSGWTLIRSSTVTGTANGYRISSYWKIAASEPANYALTTAAINNMSVEVHRINGAHATTPVNASAENSGVLGLGNPADPPVVSVTTTVVNCLVVVWLFHDHLALSQTHLPPASHVERTDYESLNTVAGNKASTTATRIFAAIGATGTATEDCTETVNTDWIAQRIAIAPGTLVLA